MDFRSSSGRYARSRHLAESHPQVLIIAPPQLEGRDLGSSERVAYRTPMCHGSGARAQWSNRYFRRYTAAALPPDSDCPVQALQPHGERRKLADVTHLRGHEETSARIIFCPRLCPLLVGVDSLCGRNLAASDRKLRS